MVDNQHQLIKGYRDLSMPEIAMINECKALGAECEKLLARIKTMDPPPDGRFWALAQTNLQNGCMWMVRSIAKPEGF